MCYQNQTIHISANSSIGDFDPFFWFFDTAGNSIAQPSGGERTVNDEQYLGFNIATPGDYYIWFSDNDYWQTGDYEFTIERIQNPVDAVDVVFNQAMTGSTSVATEIDIFPFTITRDNQAVLVTAKASGSNFNPWFWIVDNSGTSKSSIQSKKCSHKRPCVSTSISIHISVSIGIILLNVVASMPQLVSLSLRNCG